MLFYTRIFCVYMFICFVISFSPRTCRMKTHWDYVLEEMAWLANDFREERKWKQATSKRVF